MGKRSDFPRIPKDCYDTFDPKAVPPLVPHLPKGVRYIEPCAGKGDLIAQLAPHAHLVGAYDIAPRGPDIFQADALSVRADDDDADMFITNPPWTRVLLHEIIVHLSDQRPTWLLFDANWMFTVQARPFMERCRRIVVVGRLKWIPASKWTPKDDAAWYLFDRPVPGSGPRLFARGEPAPERQKRARRICADCGVLIDQFGKWRLQTRNGVSAPVHVDCRYPRTGRPPLATPLPLFDGIIGPQFTMAPGCDEPDLPDNVVPMFKGRG